MVAMPGIKRSHQDSDNEDGEQDQDSETERSSDDSSTSTASDSDDSSELDEDECEKRRIEYQSDMNELESQFTVLRELLYVERSQVVASKLEEVKMEKASEYLGPLNELKLEYMHRLNFCKKILEYRLHNIEDEYNAEVVSVDSTLEDAKNLWKEFNEIKILDEIKCLEEDRHKVALTNKVWSLQYLHRLSEKTKQDSVSPSEFRRTKPTTVSGPYIVYMLKDSDILEDWTIIKSASASKRNLPYSTISSPRHMPENLSFNGRLV